METIKALIKLKQRLGSLRTDKGTGKLMPAFENYILKNPDATDESLRQFLYPNKAGTSAYRALKTRMEDKLLNDVFLLTSDTGYESNYTFRNLLASKNYTVALCLHKFGFNHEAILLYEKTLRYCIENGITDIGIMTIKPLFNYYAFVSPNTSKMENYLEKSKQMLEVFSVEKYIQSCNARISHMYVTKKGGFTKTQMAEIEEMVNTIQNYLIRYESRSIYLLSYDLLCFYYLLISDYHCCIKLAEEALQRAKSLFPDDRHFIYKCYVNIAMANFHMRQYSGAEHWFVKALDMSAPGSRVRFHDAALYFTTLIRKGDREKILALYLEVIHDKSLKKFAPIEEQWKIRGAFVHLLIKLGKIIPDKNQLEQLPSFSVSRFLNSFNYYQQDKSGLFITIVILKIIFYLEKGNKGEIIELAEGLRQYTYKYLKNNESFRSNCFIKMLLKLIHVGFHKQRSMLHNKELHKRLINSKITLDERITEVEIIPYEDLWEIIMDICGNRLM